MTRGEYLVGITFNPGGSVLVADLKAKAAELIDLVESISHDEVPEIRRLKALAVTHFEDAAMWAVKAATKPLK